MVLLECTATLLVSPVVMTVSAVPYTRCVPRRRPPALPLPLHGMRRRSNNFRIPQLRVLHDRAPMNGGLPYP